MAGLAEIVKNILFIIILASFLEILLPDGRLKPFVRFSIGLFILISVLNPVLSWLFSEQQIEVNFWDYQSNSRQGEQIIKQGEAINRRIIESNNTVVKEKVQGQVSGMIMLVPGVQGLETRVELGQTGNLEKLYILVETGDGPDKNNEAGKTHVFSEHSAEVGEAAKAEVREKISALLCNLYGLSEKDIEIEFEGS